MTGQDTLDAVRHDRLRALPSPEPASMPSSYRLLGAGGLSESPAGRVTSVLTAAPLPPAANADHAPWNPEV